ncbi:MAG: amidohydrolase [Lachnospiraceae bacterium]
MKLNESIIKEADIAEPEVIENRRIIHRYAETGGNEIKTCTHICSVLTNLQIPYSKVGKTGVLGIMETGRPGPRIALRADIDALPMRENENNLKGARACRSENPETCHACGHDAHTAMLLGSIRVLSKLKTQLCGTIYFCFEEGEECGTGYENMLEALAVYQPDTVWAIHVYAELESGKISVDAGPRMAGSFPVHIAVEGKGGHSARPDKCINPTFTAANIVVNTAGALLNQLDAEKTVTYGITTIDAGGVSNIIPDQANIKGSLRFFDEDQGKKAIDILEQTTEHTAAIYGCKAALLNKNFLVGAVINDKKSSEIARKGIEEITSKDVLASCPPWYASESFGRYLANYKGVMAFLGIKNEEKGTGAGHHNEYFDVDESVLKLGVISTVKYVFSYQSEWEKNNHD